MLRLFIAIRMPDNIGRRLAALAGGIPGARWTGEADHHLTLRFIGEVDEGVAGDIDCGLSQIALAPFDLAVAGFGTFGTGRRLRVLWAGIDPCPALGVLKGRVDAAVDHAGVTPEDRRFVPHVTLARLDGNAQDRVAGFMAVHSPFRVPAFQVCGFSLMESRLGRHGPAYRVLRDYSAPCAAVEADGWGAAWDDPDFDRSV